jgi:L-rhamnose mutarotase
MDKKKIKRTVVAVTFIAYCSCVTLAQVTDSLVDIKGYYVVSFFKREIVSSYEQKMQKMNGKSYSIPVDYQTDRLFIPIQVGNKKICNEDVFAKEMHSYKQEDSLFVMPALSNNRLLRELKIDSRNISKSACIISEAIALSPYYEIDGDSTHLFRCVYVEGKANHIHLQAMPKQWQPYIMDVFATDVTKTNTVFFFLLEICDYNPDIELPQLSKWLPCRESTFNESIK